MRKTHENLNLISIHTINIEYSIYQGHAHAYAKTKKQNKLFPLAESTHDQRQSKKFFLLYATKSQVLESL